MSTILPCAWEHLWVWNGLSQESNDVNNTPSYIFILLFFFHTLPCVMVASILLVFLVSSLPFFLAVDTERKGESVLRWFWLLINLQNKLLVVLIYIISSIWIIACNQHYHLSIIYSKIWIINQYGMCHVSLIKTCISIQLYSMECIIYHQSSFIFYAWHISSS